MNLNDLDNEILKNFSLWLSIPPQKLRALGEISSKYPSEYYKNILDHQVLSMTEGLIRRLTHKIVKFLKESNRYYILDAIKRLRQLKRKDLIEIAQCRFVTLDKELRNKLNIPFINWQGKKAVVCLSHDIDSIEDYQYAHSVYELNKKYGLKSTFNFLTHWGYSIDRKFIDELSENDFEIGLHGYTHDIAIGVRSEERIKRELTKALQKLNYPVKGYRAPAFAITHRLLKILKELGFKYDSSVKTISCYGQAIETFYPYRYPHIGIWEIPLTIQDDRIFRDLHLSNEEGLGVIKELTQRVIAVGGVMVINNHPRLIKNKNYYYVELIKWLSGLDNVWICTTGQLVDFMERKEKQIYEF